MLIWYCFFVWCKLTYYFRLTIWRSSWSLIYICAWLNIFKIDIMKSSFIFNMPFDFLNIQIPHWIIISYIFWCSPIWNAIRQIKSIISRLVFIDFIYILEKQCFDFWKNIFCVISQNSLTILQLIWHYCLSCRSTRSHDMIGTNSMTFPLIISRLWWKTRFQFDSVMI